jgi:HAD superfamily hydrolase (TIGR01662 family)
MASTAIAGFELAARPAALLLDAGDTLIFFDAGAASAVLAAEGVALEPARLEAALHPAKRRYAAGLREGRSHEDGWSLLVLDMLTIAGLPEARARSLVKPLRRAHDELNLWRRVPSGLLEALARARAAGIRLGVVSNSEGRLRSVLEHVGLAVHFEVILDSALEGVHKPDPEIFRRALSRMGVAAERAVYAGDIPEVDVLGARGAGLHGVLVDAFGHFDDAPQWPRVPSVQALISELLALPVE